MLRSNRTCMGQSEGKIRIDRAFKSVSTAISRARWTRRYVACVGRDEVACCCVDNATA